jgi:glycosyltransferase involved in cell wall biosynthesis
MPSLQDNLPNTVLESMACGTPVVGFAVGGVPDMVRHEITGMLAPPGNIDALRSAMAALLLDGPRRTEMSRNCRHTAVEEYSIELQARRYGDLYASLVGR